MFGGEGNDAPPPHPGLCSLLFDPAEFMSFALKSWAFPLGIFMW